MIDELSAALHNFGESCANSKVLVLDDIAAGVRNLCSKFAQEGKIKGFTLEINGVDCSHPLREWPAEVAEAAATKGLLVRVRIPNAVDEHVLDLQLSLHEVECTVAAQEAGSDPGAEAVVDEIVADSKSDSEATGQVDSAGSGVAVDGVEVATDPKPSTSEALADSKSTSESSESEKSDAPEQSASPEAEDDEAPKSATTAADSEASAQPTDSASSSDTNPDLAARVKLLEAGFSNEEIDKLEAHEIGALVETSAEIAESGSVDFASGEVTVKDSAEVPNDSEATQ